MRDLRELNINDGGRPVELPPPSDELIADFEREFGVSMPRELRDFLKFSNGGHPELASVGGEDSQFGINHFYNLTIEDRTSQSLWWGMKVWQPVLGKDALVFAEDGGGKVFFLDLSKKPAEVKICIQDEDNLIVTLAPSFEVFIDELGINPDLI